MKGHVMFDRTERLFSAGQKALASRNFETAIGHLQAAIATDPEYAHLHMYLGIAKAELGRLDEGVAAIRRAIELKPRNFVFPMELGVRYLDAGDAKRARRHFLDAAGLAPGNPLVAGYVRLATWEIGEGELEEIVKQLTEIPSSLRARLLLRLCERLVERGQLPVALDDPLAVDLELTPGKTRGALTAWWRRRTVARARRQLERGDARGTLQSILALDAWNADADASALVADARKIVLEATRRELNGPVPGPPWLLRLWWRLQGRPPAAQLYAERWRRALWLELAQLQLDLGQSEEAYGTLLKWHRSFVEAHEPKAESGSAAAALAAMARIEILRGHYRRGVELCVESREYGTSYGVDWVEGIGRLLEGDRRHGRHLFEAHLRKGSGSIEPMVRRAMRLLMVILGALFFLSG